jgi:hypothetical protein
LRIRELHVRFQWDRRWAKRSLDFERSLRLSDGDIRWNWDGSFSNMRDVNACASRWAEVP